METQLNTSTQTQARLSSGLIVLAAVLWGTVGVSTRALYGLADTNALSVGFFRLAFSVPPLMLLTWRVVGRGAFRIARRDLGLMLIIGAMMALYQACYFAAIPRLGVTVAVIITICSAPVMVAGLAAIFLHEAFSARVAAALVCALAGTILVAGLTPAELAARGSEVTGVLFALGSGLGYAILALCSRALAGRYHPLQPVTISFTIGALILLLFALGSGLTTVYPLSGWGVLIYLGLVPTALGYWLFLRGMQHTTATVASILTLLEPLTSTLLAVLLFGERLQPSGWVGAALLLGALGILLVRRH